MKWYALSEADKIIGYKNGTLRVYIFKGLVKAKKMGKFWIISDKEIKKRQEAHEKWQKAQTI